MSYKLCFPLGKKGVFHDRITQEDLVACSVGAYFVSGITWLDVEGDGLLSHLSFHKRS
jgi:hypothetical protein